MKGGTPPPVLGESNQQRRRSERITSPPQATVNVDKMAPLKSVKRSIVVKKIAPRKTVLPSEHEKENAPRISEENVPKKPNISTPDPVQVVRRKKAAMPSPILASSPPRRSPRLPPPPPSSPPPPPSHPPTQPKAAAEDPVWSTKVRRSYSRLSDQSINKPNPRETMFGFENLSTPEVFRKALSKSGTEGVCSLSGLSSFTSLMDAEENCPEPDMNIPGICMGKEKKKRRRKVQKIDVQEIDSLAAKMNAEFEEAEEFELFVE
ncbi:sororin [Gadus morhua]|uniref:sororin n=1 Tax=Gadus morhua TaxID=8049 RepID=UPI0011B5FB05|nr:sororin [Gadus morhua]